MEALKRLRQEEFNSLFKKTECPNPHILYTKGNKCYKEFPSFSHSALSINNSWPIWSYLSLTCGLSRRKSLIHVIFILQLRD